MIITQFCKRNKAATQCATALLVVETLFLFLDTHSEPETFTDPKSVACGRYNALQRVDNLPSIQRDPSLLEEPTHFTVTLSATEELLNDLQRRYRFGFEDNLRSVNRNLTRRERDEKRTYGRTILVWGRGGDGDGVGGDGVGTVPV